MYLSEPYPSFPGRCRTTTRRCRTTRTSPGPHRRRGEARAVPQLQRHRPAAAPGQLLDDHRVHRRAGTGLPFDLANDGDRSTGCRSTRSRSYGDLLFSTLSSQPQLGIPLPYPGFTGTVQQALRPYPQYTGMSTQQLQGQDPLQLAADHGRASLQKRRRAARRLHAGRRPKTTCSSRTRRATSGRWRAAAGTSRTSSSSRGSTSCPSARARPSMSTACSARSSAAGRSRASTTTAAAGRSPSPTAGSMAAGFPIRPDVVERCRPGYLRRIAPRCRARHALPESCRFRHAAADGAGYSHTDRHGAAGPPRCAWPGVLFRGLGADEALRRRRRAAASSSASI